MTNVEQDESNTYVDNTINNVDDDVYDNTRTYDKEATTVKYTGKTSNKKIRRGGRNKRPQKRNCKSSLKIFSTNAASVINGKVESLKSEVICTQSNIVTIQETHCKKKGKIKIPNFVVFEAIRSMKGGGTLIAAHEDLNPKLVAEHSTEFEMLVVQVETKEKRY